MDASCSAVQEPRLDGAVSGGVPVHVDYEAERRATLERQAPMAILVLLTFTFAFGVIEWQRRPHHREALLLVDSLMVGVCLGSMGLARLFPGFAVGAVVIGVNATIACLQLYTVLVQGSGELNVIATTLILGGVVALLPLGAKYQRLASITALAGYPTILHLGARAYLDPWYSMGGLVTCVFAMSVGAGTIDRYRRHILHQAAEQAQLAAANARLVAEARAAHEAKSEFLSTVAHELRNPLGAILGYSELLRDGAFPSPEATEDTLLRIHGQAVGMLDMLQNLLDIDRADTGRLRLELSDLDLALFLADLRRDLPPSWKKPGVELAWRLPPKPLLIATDVRKLAAILRNLIHNAIKYTPAGSVTVAADERDEGIVLSVADTGEGIPAADLPFVFDRFRQARNPTRAGGVGLGLHIVKRFSDALGARIEAESEVGQGSRFVLTLPRQPLGLVRSSHGGIS